jgi:uncharacterized protein YfaP (DUF2135 family)
MRVRGRLRISRIFSSCGTLDVDATRGAAPRVFRTGSGER